MNEKARVNLGKFGGEREEGKRRNKEKKIGERPGATDTKDSGSYVHADLFSVSRWEESVASAVDDHYV